MVISADTTNLKFMSITVRNPLGPKFVSITIHIPLGPNYNS